MPFVKGQSGNPDGRPKGSGTTPTNRQIKKAIKDGSIEALDNVLTYMRDCKALIEEYFRLSMDASVAAKIESDEKIKTSLEKEAERYQTLAFKAYDKLYKTSMAILDYTVDIVHAEDRKKESSKTPADIPDLPGVVLSTQAVNE
jgi:hypothetical protein